VAFAGLLIVQAAVLDASTQLSRACGVGDGQIAVTKAFSFCNE
jgi:hypothetical protein